MCIADLVNVETCSVRYSKNFDNLLLLDYRYRWDPEYCNALAVSGSSFTSSCHPGSHSILGNIEYIEYLTGLSRVQGQAKRLR